MTGSTAAMSEEQVARVPNGLELCYQTFGDPADEPLLLVMGLSGQMIWWGDDFCRLLAGHGFFVIRFDNRDVGRSSKVESEPVTKGMLVRAFLGLPVPAPYSIGDMADDAFGLLDQLGIDTAHVFGISMGGMIAQTMAVSRSERVRSLTSMMSTTGRRTVGWLSPTVVPRMLGKAPEGLDAFLDYNVATWRLIGSPAYPFDETAYRAQALRSWQRGLSGPGVLRQMLAVLTQPDRTEALRRLTLPVLVIHGLADKMVHVSGGRATATAVPGAELMLVPGAGHDLPPELWDVYVAAIRHNADRAVRLP